MLLKKKFYKSIAITVAAISVFGSSVNTASAYQGVNQATEISQQTAEATLQNGEYKLKNIVKKDNVKPYRGFFEEETKLVVKDSKYYLTFTNAMASSVPEIKVNIDGKDVNPKIENLSEEKYEFTVELDSLDSKITMTSVMTFMDNHNLVYEVGLDMNTLEVVKLEQIAPEKPEAPETPQQPEQPQTPQQPESTDSEEVQSPNSEYKDGIYNLNNIVTDHAMPQMIRNLLSEKMTVEIKDGKNYITLNIPNYNYVGKITVTVDGKVINHTQSNNENDETATLKMEVPSLDSKINMSIYSPITKKDSVFVLKLDKSTMKLVSTNQDTNQSTGSESNSNSSNSNNINNGTTNNNSSSTSNVVVENVVAKGVRYTIKNEVISDSATAKKMGRTYLNETSKVEEVDGKTYAVLTFTGLNMMNNHRIYVDGSKVSHQVVAKTDDSVTVRFLMPSINSDIKVEVYVVPMGFDSEFNVKLIESTKGEPEEFETTSLPQTGSLLGGSEVFMAGSVLTGLGAILNRKKKKN